MRLPELCTMLERRNRRPFSAVQASSLATLVSSNYSSNPWNETVRLFLTDECLNQQEFAGSDQESDPRKQVWTKPKASKSHSQAPPTSQWKSPKKKAGRKNRQRPGRSKKGKA